ncbi:MAG: insulinase family protein [Deltaproteobacteria bacterium]|nr:insulinase family protein [Deltaproteobacteria bacterium]
MKADPDIHKTILGNGIKILTKKMPHIRSVTMGVWVDVGARDESLAENGLSHLIEHLIFKGTDKRSAFQIAKEFDAIGGQTNAFTTMENTCYHAKVIDTHLDTMVEILSDIFLNSRFDEQDIQREKPVILQEIGMVEDSPDEYIHILSGKNFWGEHPLGRSILGSRDNIKAFNADSLGTFFQKLYQPDRIIVSAAGNLEHDRLLDLLEPTFGAIATGNSFPDRTPPAGNMGLHISTRDLEQVHICLSTHGLPIADPGRYALSLMNTILGGNMSSRLFQEIREKRGLAYTVYSFNASHVDTGMFGAYAAVDTSKALETIKLLLEQLFRLKHEKVKENELTGAKEFIKGNLFLASESSENQMVRLAQNEFHFGQSVPLKKVVQQIEAVTVDDIQRLVNMLLGDNTLSLTMLGNVTDRTAHEELLDAFTKNR